MLSFLPCGEERANPIYTSVLLLSRGMGAPKPPTQALRRPWFYRFSKELIAWSWPPEVKLQESRENWEAHRLASAPTFICRFWVSFGLRPCRSSSIAPRIARQMLHPPYRLPRAAHLPARPPDRRILAVLVDEELGGAVDVEVRDHALLKPTAWPGDPSWTPAYRPTEDNNANYEHHIAEREQWCMPGHWRGLAQLASAVGAKRSLELFID